MRAAASVRASILIIILVVMGTGLATDGWSQRESSCTRGTPNAPIRLDVYSDYESPASRAFFLQTMKSVFKDYADTGKACVIYRDFPQNNHPHANEAARYARAAMQLGLRQWALMAEALFQNQAQWSGDGNIDKAVVGALSPSEMETLRKRLNDPSLADAISNDELSGLAQQVRATPTIILTGAGQTQTIEGALRYAALQPRLDELLAE